MITKKMVFSLALLASSSAFAQLSAREKPMEQDYEPCYRCPVVGLAAGAQAQVSRAAGTVGEVLELSPTYGINTSLNPNAPYVCTTLLNVWNGSAVVPVAPDTDRITILQGAFDAKAANALVSFSGEGRLLRANGLNNDSNVGGAGINVTIEYRPQGQAAPWEQALARIVVQQPIINLQRTAISSTLHSPVVNPISAPILVRNLTPGVTYEVRVTAAWSNLNTSMVLRSNPSSLAQRVDQGVGFPNGTNAQSGASGAMICTPRLHIEQHTSGFN